MKKRVSASTREVFKSFPNFDWFSLSSGWPSKRAGKNKKSIPRPPKEAIEAGLRVGCLVNLRDEIFYVCQIRGDRMMIRRRGGDRPVFFWRKIPKNIIIV